MLALREVQRHFRAALLGADAGPAAATVCGDGFAPDARLAIYRHHVQTTLTEALAATFPVVRRLVDPRFFAYAADRYIRERPPSGPCLHEYGTDFADFLAAFPPCRSFPYLADVARLEWALTRAYHADDAAPLDLARLARVPPPRVAGLALGLHPAITVLESPWPIDDIWRANQPDADRDLVVDLGAGAVALEVALTADEPVFRRLDPADARFRRMLAEGRTLADAAEDALRVAPDFDLARALHQLLAEGAVVDILDRPDEEIMR